MIKCAQLLDEQTDIDFIDINMGCPIDLIYKQVFLVIKKVVFGSAGVRRTSPPPPPSILYDV